ncbi:MAG: MbcA/ParS/Xre antitoxin family protein [Planctomycetota bacterium]|nr:MbcA/ParS/Xre antitoxin family protein [Planctomycetota bacterium]
MGSGKRKQEKRQARAKRKQAENRAQRNLSFENLTSLPVYECLMTRDLFANGIGVAVLSRRHQDGRIGAAIFLLDTYCLGVKDAYRFFGSSDDYVWQIRRHEKGVGAWQKIEPACLRKLVESAVAYASDLGFAPHPDYSSAARLFGDIDASACRETFVFGKDGKPLYIAGPRESPARQQAILATLRARCGDDGFHFVLPLFQREGADDYEIDEAESDEEEGVGDESGDNADLPPQVLAEVAQKYFHDYYLKRWIDESIPALDNLSPRQACRTPEGRARVRELIASIPMPFGPAPIDIAAIRQELCMALGLL